MLVVVVAMGGAYAALARYDLVGLGHLPRVAIFALFLLILVNAAAAALRGRRLFSRGQMAFIYIAILVMAGFPGQQLVTYLYLGMLGPAYYAHANPEARYQETFMGYLPSWMVPSKNGESPAILWAFEGVPEGAHLPWHPWVKPLLAWTPYLLALLVLQMCVAALLRRRWADEEQLTFPLARIPVELTSYSGERAPWPTAFRRPIFWLAFAVPVSIQSLYALHQYFPSLPQIDLNRNIGVVGPKPWDELNFLPYSVYFGVIGITALIPSDIGFSLWFFWLARRFIAVARSALGYQQHWVFFEQQGLGAYVFLAAIYLWMARHTFVRAARDVFLRREGDENEPASGRLAFLGCLGSIAAILLWGRLGGASPGPVLLMIGLWLAGIIVLTRLVSESGILVVWTAIGAPQVHVVRALGLEAVNPRTVTVASFMGWKIQDTASCTMASVMQGYRIGGLVRARPRAVFWLAAASLAVALFASHPASVKTIYALGVPKLGWWPRGAAESLPGTINALLTAPNPYKFGDYGNMITGAIVVGVLQALRLRFPWFPLSPLAFAFVMGPQFASDRYGFSIFVGWALKAGTVRMGGRRAFEVLRFAALGIIVGDAAVLSVWTAMRYFFPVGGEALIIE